MKVDLHLAFFPERVPHPALRSERHLQWLRRCGMAETLSRSAFTEAARKVHHAADAISRPSPTTY